MPQNEGDSEITGTKSIVEQFRALQIEHSREKKKREAAERELVLQNHRNGNLLRSKEEECKFWQNKVSRVLTLVSGAESENKDNGVRGREQREAE